jgi:hypothetical protein
MSRILDSFLTWGLEEQVGVVPATLVAETCLLTINSVGAPRTSICL